MPRTFRFEPPAPRSGLLTRPRLLRALLGRWDHPVTTVIGGPGFGKTTVLSQAVAENRLAQRGQDLWVTVERADAEGESLAQAITTAVMAADAGRPAGGSGIAPRAASPRRLADALWRRAPLELCLVLDDLHVVPPGSPAAAWLAELIQALPSNGHLVLASRTAPPVPLDDLDQRGQVLRVTEGDLRFSDAELSQFAAGQELDVQSFAVSAGWPAMAELAASVGGHMAGAYLWEEVLEPLGAERRRILAVLGDLGGADDALAAAVLGAPIRLADALAGVPLVARAAGGWCAPHALWSTAPGIDLPAGERAVIRQRAIDHLLSRDRFDEAFTLASDAGLWDLVPAILRAACVAGTRPDPGRLRRWVSTSPPEVLETPAGHLAVGLDAAFSRPNEATGALRQAAKECRAVDDVDGELVALAQLGRVAWWYQDSSQLEPVGRRIAELASDGHPMAQGLAAVGLAVAADVAGDDDATLAVLASVEPGSLDPGWETMARWLQGRVRLFQGDAETPLAIVDQTLPRADPAMRVVLQALRLSAWWAQGRIDDVVAQLPGSIDAATTAGIEYNRRNGLAQVSTLMSHVGEVERAERLLCDIDPRGDYAELAAGFLTGAVALASLRVATGDEDDAAAVLRHAIDADGLDQGTDRRVWRQALPLSYVLLPEVRDHWDGIELGGHLATARTLAVALTRLRDHGDAQHLRHLALPAVGAIRSALHHRLAAELAVGLAAVGRPEAAGLLEALGPPGRAAVRDLASGARPRATRAKALLSALPALPARRRYLAVLGPLALREGGATGDEVTDPEIRRERVRMMLAFLVTHRRIDRAAAAAALWPRLDERAAANNLRVTLNYLLRVLEPWRAAGEPAFLVRLDGTDIELVTGDHLQIDADRFDRHIAAAARAEAEGSPAATLEHDLAAVELYRGEFHAGGADADWLAVERDHYRTRFVTAATRAAQLLVGRNDTDGSAALARRVLAVHPWSEEAYAVLAAGALARGDRAAARRVLERCEEMLHDLGVGPSETTRQLDRRVRSGA